MSFARFIAWKTFQRFPSLRTSLTNVLVRDEDVDIELFGAKLCVNKRAEIGLWRAAQAADHNIVFRDEVASILNLAMLLQPGDVFVDIGANVGLYSALLSRLARVAQGNRFVAVEANPETARRLRRSLAETSVQVIDRALSDHDGELHFAPGVTSGVFGATSAGAANSVTLPCSRLDSPDLPNGDLVLKVDVEGHELEVLRGADRLFDAERVKVVYVDGYSAMELPQFLRERGFTFYDGRTLQPSTEAPPYSLLAVHAMR